jgi:hypothetical protein
MMHLHGGKAAISAPRINNILVVSGFHHESLFTGIHAAKHRDPCAYEKATSLNIEYLFQASSENLWNSFLQTAAVCFFGCFGEDIS